MKMSFREVSGAKSKQSDFEHCFNVSSIQSDSKSRNVSNNNSPNMQHFRRAHDKSVTLTSQISIFLNFLR